jgi:hypothetical protein
MDVYFRNIKVVFSEKGAYVSTVTSLIEIMNFMKLVKVDNFWIENVKQNTSILQISDSNTELDNASLNCQRTSGFYE